MNKVILIGHVGGDAELRTPREDFKVANFSLATSESYKDKSGEWQKVTEWHRITAYRGLAEKAERVAQKGAMIAVEGKVKYRTVDKDGHKTYYTDIEADTITLLAKPNERSENGGERSQAAEDMPQYDTAKANASVDDDLPF